MSAVDFGEDLSQSNLNIAEIAKLLTAVQTRNQPLEDDIVVDYATVSPHRHLHATEVIIIAADLVPLILHDHITYFPYCFRVPNNPYPYDLVHSTIGAGFTFPDNKKHAGTISNDGNAHIQIDHSARMNMGTDAFAIAFWIAKTTTGAYTILSKRDGTGTGFDVTVNGNNLSITLDDGTDTVTLSVSDSIINDGEYHSVIINISSSLEIFIDNTSKGTQVRGTVSNINNTDNALIFAKNTGGTISQGYEGVLSWLIWKKTEIFSSSQRADYHTNGIIDLQTTVNVECVTMPFMANVAPLPNTMPGLFTAS